MVAYISFSQTYFKPGENSGQDSPPVVTKEFAYAECYTTWNGIYQTIYLRTGVMMFWKVRV